MKQDLILGLFSVFMFFALLGCSTKCEDFNSGITNWAPYKQNDKIALTCNSGADTLSVHSSRVEHTEKIGFGMKCACMDMYMVYLSSATMAINIRFNSSRVVSQSEIQVNDEWMNFSEEVESMEINGHVYTNLILFVNSYPDVNHTFNQVILAKSIGIVAIIGDEQTWTIMENTPKSIDMHEIDYNGRGC
jgi:hypothetical protein